MATEFKEIEEYVETKWFNYNPPSIDQDNLFHLEKNIKLNRDTINEIIKRLGATPPEGGSSEDQDIYNKAIYETLIDFKNKINQLNDGKVDNSTFNTKVANLQEQIDNRLRKDQDDVSTFSYTFKTLTLTGALNVTTTSVLTGAVSAKSTITATGKITANGGLEASSIKSLGDVTFNKALTVSGASALNGGLSVKGGGNVVGTLTVDNLIVNGDISCTGNATITKKLTCKELDAKRQVTIYCEDNGNLWLKKNYIELGSSAEHRLWVQGANTSLRSGDALIKTFS